MTKNIKLIAESRNIKATKAKQIRNEGLIPAVVYGSVTENKNLKIKRIDFERAFETAGEFNLIDLVIDNQPPAKVIIKEVQKDAVKNDIIHVDFYQVDMTKKITTVIPLNFIGEAKAVKELGGTLVKNMDNVGVKCLPGNLVNHIDVDLSSLNNFNDFIRLHDLKLPNGMELASETNEVVVGVKEIKIEEEPVKPVEEVPAEPLVTEAAEEGKEATTDGKAETKEEKAEKKEDKK